MIILQVPLSSGSVELMTILHVVSSGLLKVTLSLSILKSNARKTLQKIFCVIKLTLLDILIAVDVFEAYLEVREVPLSADSADGS